MLPTTSTRWPVLCSCCKQSGLDVRPKKHSEHYSVWQSLKGCSLVDNVTLLGTKGEWGGEGDLLLTLFHREKQDRSTSCVTRVHLKKDPSAAAPLQCWSMCRQISHAGVSRNTFKKVPNIGHNEFSALHPYYKKKTPFLEEISLKSKNLVTKGLYVWVLCVWIGRIYPTWWPNIL